MASLRFEGVVSLNQKGEYSLLLSNASHPGQRFDGWDLELLFRMYPGHRMTILIDVDIPVSDRRRG